MIVYCQLEPVTEMSTSPKRMVNFCQHNWLISSHIVGYASSRRSHDHVALCRNYLKCSVCCWSPDCCDPCMQVCRHYWQSSHTICTSKSQWADRWKVFESKYPNLKPMVYVIVCVYGRGKLHGMYIYSVFISRWLCLWNIKIKFDVEETSNSP